MGDAPVPEAALGRPAPARRDFEDDVHYELAAALYALGQELRCSVCLSLLKDPSFTPCGHTFCRECIRTWISSQGKCPLCKTAISVRKLRPDDMMEELVRHFRDLQPESLRRSWAAGAVSSSASAARSSSAGREGRAAAPPGSRGGSGPALDSAAAAAAALQSHRAGAPAAGTASYFGGAPHPGQAHSAAAVQAAGLHDPPTVEEEAARRRGEAAAATEIPEAWMLATQFTQLPALTQMYAGFRADGQWEESGEEELEGGAEGGEGQSEGQLVEGVGAAGQAAEEEERVVDLADGTGPLLLLPGALIHGLPPSDHSPLVLHPTAAVAAAAPAGVSAAGDYAGVDAVDAALAADWTGGVEAAAGDMSRASAAPATTDLPPSAADAAPALGGRVGTEEGEGFLAAAPEGFSPLPSLPGPGAPGPGAQRSQISGGLGWDTATEAAAPPVPGPPDPPLGAGAFPLLSRRSSASSAPPPTVHTRTGPAPLRMRPVLHAASPVAAPLAGASCAPAAFAAGAGGGTFGVQGAALADVAASAASGLYTHHRQSTNGSSSSSSGDSGSLASSAATDPSATGTSPGSSGPQGQPLGAGTKRAGCVITDSDEEEEEEKGHGGGGGGRGRGRGAAVAHSSHPHSSPSADPPSSRGRAEEPEARGTPPPPPAPVPMLPAPPRSSIWQTALLPQVSEAREAEGGGLSSSAAASASASSLPTGNGPAAAAAAAPSDRPLARSWLGEPIYPPAANTITVSTSSSSSIAPVTSAATSAVGVVPASDAPPPSSRASPSASSSSSGSSLIATQDIAAMQEIVAHALALAARKAAAAAAAGGQQQQRQAGTGAETESDTESEEETGPNDGMQRSFSCLGPAAPSVEGAGAAGTDAHAEAEVPASATAPRSRLPRPAFGASSAAAAAAMFYEETPQCFPPDTPQSQQQQQQQGLTGQQRGELLPPGATTADALYADTVAALSSPAAAAAPAAAPSPNSLAAAQRRSSYRAASGSVPSPPPSSASREGREQGAAPTADAVSPEQGRARGAESPAGMGSGGSPWGYSQNLRELHASQDAGLVAAGVLDSGIGGSAGRANKDAESAPTPNVYFPAIQTGAPSAHDGVAGLQQHEHERLHADNPVSSTVAAPARLGEGSTGTSAPSSVSTLPGSLAMSGASGSSAEEAQGRTASPFPTPRSSTVSVTTHATLAVPGVSGSSSVRGGTDDSGGTRSSSSRSSGGGVGRKRPLRPASSTPQAPLRSALKRSAASAPLAAAADAAAAPATLSPTASRRRVSAALGAEGQLSAAPPTDPAGGSGTGSGDAPRPSPALAPPLGPGSRGSAFTPRGAPRPGAPTRSEFSYECSPTPGSPDPAPGSPDAESNAGPSSAAAAAGAVMVLGWLGGEEGGPVPRREGPAPRVTFADTPMYCTAPTQDFSQRSGSSGGSLGSVGRGFEALTESALFAAAAGSATHAEAPAAAASAAAMMPPPPVPGAPAGAGGSASLPEHAMAAPQYRTSASVANHALAADGRGSGCIGRSLAPPLSPSAPLEACGALVHGAATGDPMELFEGQRSASDPSLVPSGEQSGAAPAPSGPSWSSAAQRPAPAPGALRMPHVVTAPRSGAPMRGPFTPATVPSAYAPASSATPHPAPFATGGEAEQRTGSARPPSPTPGSGLPRTPRTYGSRPASATPAGPASAAAGASHLSAGTSHLSAGASHLSAGDSRHTPTAAPVPDAPLAGDAEADSEVSGPPLQRPIGSSSGGLASLSSSGDGISTSGPSLPPAPAPLPPGKPLSASTPAAPIGSSSGAAPPPLLTDRRQRQAPSTAPAPRAAATPNTAPLPDAPHLSLPDEVPTRGAIDSDISSSSSANGGASEPVGGPAPPGSRPKKKKKKKPLEQRPQDAAQGQPPSAADPGPRRLSVGSRAAAVGSSRVLRFVTTPHGPAARVSTAVAAPQSTPASRVTTAQGSWGSSGPSLLGKRRSSDSDEISCFTVSDGEEEEEEEGTGQGMAVSVLGGGDVDPWAVPDSETHAQAPRAAFQQSLSSSSSSLAAAPRSAPAAAAAGSAAAAVARKGVPGGKLGQLGMLHAPPAATSSSISRPSSSVAAAAAVSASAAAAAAPSAAAASQSPPLPQPQRAQQQSCRSLSQRPQVQSAPGFTPWVQLIASCDCGKADTARLGAVVAKAAQAAAAMGAGGAGTGSAPSIQLLLDSAPFCNPTATAQVVRRQEGAPGLRAQGGACTSSGGPLAAVRAYTGPWGGGAAAAPSSSALQSRGGGPADSSAHFPPSAACASDVADAASVVARLLPQIPPHLRAVDLSSAVRWSQGRVASPADVIGAMLRRAGSSPPTESSSSFASAPRASSTGVAGWLPPVVVCPATRSALTLDDLLGDALAAGGTWGSGAVAAAAPSSFSSSSSSSSSASGARGGGVGPYSGRSVAAEGGSSSGNKRARTQSPAVASAAPALPASKKRPGGAGAPPPPGLAPLLARRRSHRYMCALLSGALLVSPEWLEACARAGGLVHEAPYLVMGDRSTGAQAAMLLGDRALGAALEGAAAAGERIWAMGAEGERAAPGEGGEAARSSSSGGGSAAAAPRTLLRRSSSGSSSGKGGAGNLAPLDDAHAPRAPSRQPSSSSAAAPAPPAPAPSPVTLHAPSPVTLHAPSPVTLHAPSPVTLHASCAPARARGAVSSGRPESLLFAPVGALLLWGEFECPPKNTTRGEVGELAALGGCRLAVEIDNLLKVNWTQGQGGSAGAEGRSSRGSAAAASASGAEEDPDPRAIEPDSIVVLGDWEDGVVGATRQRGGGSSGGVRRSSGGAAAPSSATPHFSAEVDVAAADAALWAAVAAATLAGAPSSKPSSSSAGAAPFPFLLVVCDEPGFPLPPCLLRLAQARPGAVAMVGPEWLLDSAACYALMDPFCRAYAHPAAGPLVAAARDGRAVMDLS